MRVEEAMSRPVRTCKDNDTLDHVARLMWEHGVGSVVVEAKGRVRGVITDRDICLAGRFYGKGLWTIPASEVMSINVDVVLSHDSVDVAERLMRTRQIRRLPVVDESWNLVGLLSLDDLARETRTHEGRGKPAVRAEDVGKTLAEISNGYDTSEPFFSGT
jgi:CBS domain-containing protein